MESTNKHNLLYCEGISVIPGAGKPASGWLSTTRAYVCFSGTREECEAHIAKWNSYRAVWQIVAA